MKNFLLVLSTFILFNCEDELSNKIPSFEARVNGTYQWQAENFSATVENNKISISGISPFGAISVIVNSNEANRYNFNSFSENIAVFQDTLQYSTQYDGLGSIAYLSEGFLDIREIDNINNYITGHFHFDAYNGTGEYTINISEGVFYKIPIDSGDLD